jgi:hypothetical protein
MSTNRKWKMQWSYGYAGTDNEDVIDLIDDHGEMIWIDHYRLTDVRGLDWSRMEQIMNRLYWTMGIMAFAAALVFAGYLDSLT